MTYKIVRFYRELAKPYKIIRTGLTLDEAQAHCEDESTHGEGWFDGYEEETDDDLTYGEGKTHASD